MITLILSILCVFLGFLLGYSMSSGRQQKEAIIPQPIPQQKPNPAPVNPSCLEDKIWYEEEIKFLFKFNEKLSLNLKFQDAVQCIAEAAHNFLPIERAALLTWDNNSQTFTLASAVGWNHERGREPSVIGIESISGYVIRNKETLLVSNLSGESYLKALKKEDYLQKAFISAPLIAKDEILGVLHVCDKRTGEPFTQRDISVVMNIVRMGAIALQNARLYEQVSKRAEELKLAYDELKEMQDKLIQSEKLKAIGQLASGVAHEMRNPLGIIMQGITYLGHIITPEQQDQYETLTMIRDSAQRADKIVNQLLDFSRATKLELHPEHIATVIDNSLNLVKVELKKIEVVKEIQENMPMVLLDKNKLTQVFINLFINAVHAMSGEGRLTIRNFVKESEELPGEKLAVIEIEDTGSGITEENLKRIFDPFFTTKGQGKGTGLGLSVTRNIILMHKGLVEVKSEVGKGTKIIIALRITKEEGWLNV